MMKARGFFVCYRASSHDQKKVSSDLFHIYMPTISSWPRIAVMTSGFKLMISGVLLRWLLTTGFKVCLKQLFKYSANAFLLHHLRANESPDVRILFFVAIMIGTFAVSVYQPWGWRGKEFGSGLRWHQIKTLFQQKLQFLTEERLNLWHYRANSLQTTDQ